MKEVEIIKIIPHVVRSPQRRIWIVLCCLLQQQALVKEHFLGWRRGKEEVYKKAMIALMSLSALSHLSIN